MGLALKSDKKSCAYALAFALLAATSLITGTTHASPQLRAAAPKAWILQNSEAIAADGGSDEQGTRSLLYDHQVLVGARDVQAYTRWVQAITDRAGLDAVSQLTIEFDSDESLVLHHVRVQRDGKTLDRLNLSEVRIAQRESRLEQQIYDGTKTAILFVADLRVGDILDYAYTRQARGEDKFNGHFVLGLTQPVQHLHLRVIAPSARPLTDIWHGPQGDIGPDPKIVSQGKQTQYTWDLRSTPAYAIEASTPAWYEPLPWVQMTEFNSWEEVARWGGRVVSVPVYQDSEIRNFLAELPPGSDSERMLRVIRFVQDEVRYVGIETGLSRTRAAAPSTVLKRRYGDCKDKSGLLIALLRGLGVSAYPMLVNSRVRSRLHEWVPSPSAFDHAIVMIEADGGPYWVDSTSKLQGGGLERLRYSEFGQGLVLRDDTTKLTHMPSRPSATPARREAVDRFTLAAPEAAVEATLECDRLYVGEEAEQMRLLMSSLNAEQRSKLMLSQLQQDYPQARETAPPSWQDDRDNNQLRVQLHYAMPKLWSACKSGEVCTAQILARPIANALEGVSNDARKAPLAVLYPFDLRYWAEINLPFEIAGAPQRIETRGPAFSFVFDGKTEKQKLRTAYALRMHADSVPVSKLAEHRKALEEADAQLVRLIERRSPIADGIHWWMVALAALIAGVTASAAYWYLRRPRTAAADARTQVVALNIGGWLVVLGIGLISKPISLVRATLPVARLVFSRASWDQLTHAVQADSNMALIIFSVLALVIIETVLWLALLPVFWLRRREFRKSFVAVTVLSICVGLLATHLSNLVSTEELPAGESWPLTLARCIVPAMWAAYVWYSKRPLATFVL